MSTRVELALRAVARIAGRSDPTVPMPVGALAADLGIGLSSASRLCAGLVEEGLLARSVEYGAHRVGPAAIALSGAAAAPTSRVVRLELTRVSLQTGETVCLAAPASDTPRLVAVIDSPWTLHAPAVIGDVVSDGASAICQAACGRVVGPAFESRVGGQVEVATPVLDPEGERVGVLAVRMPAPRSHRGVPVARRVLHTARRNLERGLVDARHSRPEVARRPHTPTPPTTSLPPLRAALRILDHLTSGHDSVPRIAAACGLRLDRTRRLVEACRRAGLVLGDDQRVRLSWGVHGWYRAAANPALVAGGAPLVAETAATTGTCAFLTVLKGLRSFTLVERLAGLGDGLQLRPWLGRAHPIIGSDGGPTMLMDLAVGQLADLLPARVGAHDRAQFLDQVEQATRDGVLAIEAPAELGITSISAPVRDASGTVAAAACLVGATEQVRTQRTELEAATRRLAARVSALLG